MAKQSGSLVMLFAGLMGFVLGLLGLILVIVVAAVVLDQLVRSGNRLLAVR